MKSEEMVTCFLSSVDEEMYFEGVINHTKEISNIRHINSYYTQLAAIYHKYSELKHSNKKNHKLVDKILVNLGLESEERAYIKKALKQMEDKTLISDEISEVVKDAIALTRYDLNLKKSKIDKARYQYALSKGSEIAWGDVSGKDQVYKIIKDMQFYLEDLSDDSIHEIRISIRKLMAILWLLDQGSFGLSQSDREDMGKELRLFLKMFTKAREYAVLLEQMDELGFEEVSAYAKKKLKASKSKIKKKLDEDRRNQIMMTCKDLFKNCEKIDFKHMSVREVLHLYQDFISNLDVQEETTLHKFRIEGKTCKYLHEMNIIRLDDETFNLIKKLHKQIGIWHDVQVNRELTNEWIKNDKIDLSKKKINKLLDQLEAIEDKTYKKIEIGVFKMKKHLNIAR